MAEDLKAKQHRFVTQLAEFLPRALVWAQTHGYQLALGEAYRTPEQAKANAQNKIGIANSLHTERLALDLILRKDGVAVWDSAAYRDLGQAWKLTSMDAAWGGDFRDSLGRPKPDGGHFSLRHGGRA